MTSGRKKPSKRWKWVLLEQREFFFGVARTETVPKYYIRKTGKNNKVDPYGGLKVIGEFDSREEARAMQALLT